MPWIEPSARLTWRRHLLGPQSRALQVADQVGVDLEELARQGLPFEQVGHLGLDALVAAGDRRDRGRGRDGDQQGIAQPEPGDPFPQAACQRSGRVGVDPPQVELQMPGGRAGLGRKPGAARATSASSVDAHRAWK